MKIDMTEKEAMERFYQSWQGDGVWVFFTRRPAADVRRRVREAGIWYLGDPEEGLNFFRTVMGFLGVTFKPEEPELPKRIYAVGHTLRIEHEEDALVENCSWATIREAAARYNAVERILEPGRGIDHKGNIEAILDQEREKLT